jgi:hypothetical protein
MIVGLVLILAAHPLLADEYIEPMPVKEVTILVGTGEDTRLHTVDVTAEDHLVAFGSRQSELIETGLVMWNGRLIPPPYRVSRQGLIMVINDIPLNTISPLGWPPARSVDPDQDPGEPPPELIILPRPTADETAAQWDRFWLKKFAWEVKKHNGDSADAAKFLIAQYFSKSNDPTTRQFTAGSEGLVYALPGGGTLVYPLVNELSLREQEQSDPRILADRYGRAYISLVDKLKGNQLVFQFPPFSFDSKEHQILFLLNTVLAAETVDAFIAELDLRKNLPRPVDDDAELRPSMIRKWQEFYASIKMLPATDIERIRKFIKSKE